MKKHKCEICRKKADKIMRIGKNMRINYCDHHYDLVFKTLKGGEQMNNLWVQEINS